MMSVGIAAILGFAILLIGMFLIVASLTEREFFWATLFSVISGCAVILIIAAAHVDTHRERVIEFTKYADIKEVGTAENPKQVAVVDEAVIDVSAMTNTLLYDADIYYLRIIRRVDSCMAEKRACFIYRSDTTEYTVVPRSLVEVQ